MKVSDHKATISIISHDDNYDNNFKIGKLYRLV